MNLSFYIAKKYFVSKSKQKIVNIINYISIALITISTASLLIVLSGFSGLKNYGLSFTEGFEPDFRLESKSGKSFFLDQNSLDSIRQNSNIKSISTVIQDKVFLNFNQKSSVAFLRGVDSIYNEMIPIDNFIGTGQWISDEFNEIVVGSQIANDLNLGVFDYNDFLFVKTFEKSPKGLGVFNPFRTKKTIVSGIFSVGEEFDGKYLFSNINLARNLFQLAENRYSYLFINSEGNVSKETLMKDLKRFFKDPIILKSKEELNPTFYKMLNTENIAVYLIFSFIIIISLFNVVGSLSMMILEKRDQFKIFQSMGLNIKDIKKIFLYLGIMISWVGGFLGVLVGSFLLAIQFYNPFLYVPNTNIPYPISFELNNYIIVAFTIISLGAVTSAWVTSGFNKNINKHLIV